MFKFDISVSPELGGGLVSLGSIHLTPATNSSQFFSIYYLFAGETPNDSFKSIT